MKLLLSDINQGIIIAGIISIATLVVTLVVIPLLNKLINKVTEIHVEMNGMKSELVKTTEALGILKGNKQGREELIQEQKDESKK